MGRKNIQTPDSIIKSASGLLDKRVKNIKYTRGVGGNRSITSDGGTSEAYGVILFKLLEMMMLDVIAGDIVYFNRKKKGFFFVYDWPPTASYIRGKGLDKDMKIPVLELSKNGYKVPIIAYDPGGDFHLCKVHIPSYLYGVLIESVNAGKKYAKGFKKFWFDK